ncbi:hypothetical protein KSP40_PGU012267 [Platanthera guangdongensis]|uniref:Cleavage stimulation factor subunit 2 n=1 Tax=Platanthera guangdongensis TaxID=2320717 RepID=A0ABR2MNR7_9ASPA
MEARQHQQQQLSGDGFTSHITGLSKSQLFEIMSQMKGLIDQNQKQARTILIENPLLTRALFQAQIMLGMVQPPQVMPNVQQQGQSQSARAGQKSITQTAQALPAQAGLQGQKSSPQPSVPARQQPLPHVSISVPSASVPPLNYQQQQMISAPPHLAQQAKGFYGASPGPPPSQSSQIRSIPASPHTHSHYSMHQSHVPLVSSQTQPSLQTPGMFHQPLQPPLPQQPRPHLHPFSHQLSSQMPHSLNFQPSNAPQQPFSQTLFHSGSLPPSSFPQGQPPLPSQPPPQQLYQGGGPIMSSDYRNHAGTSMQAERGPWMRGLKENPMPGQFPYLPPLSLGQMHAVPVGQPPRLPLLSPEMEKAVLQQVLMLTPEQINLLPPEQRNQVLEIQEILR